MTPKCHISKGGFVTIIVKITNVTGKSSIRRSSWGITGRQVEIYSWEHSFIGNLQDNDDFAKLYIEINSLWGHIQHFKCVSLEHQFSM